MRLYIKKFGKTLTSREDGREAFSAIQPTMRGVKKSENVELDFEGVNTLAPSWGDEFLSPFFKKYGNRLTLRHTKNASVLATIDMLEHIHNIHFKKNNFPMLKGSYKNSNTKTPTNIQKKSKLVLGTKRRTSNKKIT